jgi:hypothetical protein
LNDELVVVTTAPNEPEAAVVVGYLESAGVRAIYRSEPQFALGSMVGALGSPMSPQEILVTADDLAKAQQALAARDEN